MVVNVVMFNKLIPKSVLAGSFSILFGCTGVASILGGHVKAYEGNELEDSKLAIIKNRDGSSPHGSAYVRSIDGVTYGDDLLRGWPSVVKTLPGKHTISVKCNFYNNGYANLSFETTFYTGKHYELRCEAGKDGYLRAFAVEY